MTQSEQYCTYFDSNYLVRALALHASLQRVSPGAVLWALCLDRSAADTLARLALPTFRPVTLAELEAADRELAAVKPTRSQVEYYFTCTPALLNHLFLRAERIERLTYLDADLWFLADPAPLFAELSGHSVSIVPHRFPARLRRLEAYGRYNVGWLTFVHDARGGAVLADWRARCIEWCFDRLEGDRFADQKYLDAWPARFDGVREIEHRGANVAPWNLAGEALAWRDRALHAGRWPLLFFHFHGFKRIRPWLFDPGLSAYGVRMTPLLRERLFAPYVTELRELERGLRARVPDFGGAWGTARPTGWSRLSIAKKWLTGYLIRLPERAERGRPVPG